MIFIIQGELKCHIIMIIKINVFIWDLMKNLYLKILKWKK